jgi:hypothetical protein
MNEQEDQLQERFLAKQWEAVATGISDADINEWIGDHLPDDPDKAPSDAVSVLIRRALGS